MAKKENITLDDLQEQVRTYIFNEDDLNKIEKAIQYSEEKHAGQLRKSGELYFTHLVNVAYILSTLHVSPVTIIAGLLHDVIEDCDVSPEELSAEFGEEVTGLVESVTKIGNIKFKDEKEYLAENHRKILIAMAHDIRVIYIKLVDRLHNMRTLKFQPEYKQKKIANETLSVYAPIAHRLGISEIKNELEDLSFYYLDQREYYDIAQKIEMRKTQRDAQVASMIDHISALLIKNSIPHRVFGRSKHLYSIHKKMVTKNKRFDEILDLLAIRIITEDEVSCYEILGHIHAQYRPIPGRLKDYIAVPKMNMYQSLHTTIVGDDGHIFEIQIRTERMDQIAERGVAAHWRYKEGESSAMENQREIEERLAWFRDLEVLDNEDATTYMETLQKDVFEANVYVMSPNGRVIDLPNGATPIDFAYRIHTEVGDSAIGSIVNGTLVPLNTILKTGDVVQIRTSKTSSGPSEDWLKFVKTNRARSKIKNFFLKKEQESRQVNITKGEQMFKEELKKRNLDEKEYFVRSKLEPLYNQFSLRNYDDFMNAIGVKSLSLQRVFEKLDPKRNILSEFGRLFTGQPEPPRRKVSKSGIKVEGVDTMMISIAQCCSPVRGDEIIGYITKGKGVKVHRVDCPNIINERSRLIDVEWDEEFETGTYEAALSINAYDRQFLLTDIVTAISQSKASITYVNAQIDEDKIHSIISLRVSVKNSEELRVVMANIRKVDSVIDISRKQL
ncbi:MAG TPA: bifunctional (p)ppGpp synthetase/guanosine-3',5'-bis(diphosphate) 3'-pyrophosphohydrolase [Erysipelothrix sp.]|jgi:GTP pyrophosphokinase|nr:bifunctional (p)ppGpp synthetase/guanosine-3',5'-bis(diphosphate) 3'-pyrophosphohydrolase [Erysipelothrix sp.]